MVYIKRDLEKKLLKYLENKEILAVIGPRQSGKTTIVKKILSNTTNKKIKEVSFDNISDLELFITDLDSFIKKYVENTDILFIDEIQRANKSGLQLKYIFDNYKNIKIIVSGSSSVDIAIKCLKYLVGRIFVFNLYSFSFNEFLKAKDIDLYNVYIENKYKDVVLKKINKYLNEYLIYGGYPKVVLSKDNEEKKVVLKNIYNTHALRDVKDIISLSDDFMLNDLIKALSLQIGDIVNYTNLSSVSGYKYEKLKRVFSVLNKTYICVEIRPFFKNKTKEITKSKKVYFCDLGLRNQIINNFLEDVKFRQDVGKLHENFILLELINNEFEVKYWNAKSKAEVDFIIEKSGKIIPIEVKTTVKKENLTRSFNSFLTKYNPDIGFVATKDFEKTIKKDNTVVYFVPYVKLIQKIKEVVK
jgi:uncharacterized protein